MGELGECAAHALGVRFFVFGGIPGEVVEAEVVRVRRRYVAARVVEVHEPSPHRVSPPCPYFWPCTGCQWQHIAYEHQLTLKREMVRDTFAGVPDLADVPVLPVIPSEQQYGLSQTTLVSRLARRGPWDT